MAKHTEEDNWDKIINEFTARQIKKDRIWSLIRFAMFIVAVILLFYLL